MKTRIIKIDEGQNYDAWYHCTDGNVYYDSMYCGEKMIGDVILTEYYQNVSKQD